MGTTCAGCLRPQESRMEMSEPTHNGRCVRCGSAVGTACVCYHCGNGLYDCRTQKGCHCNALAGALRDAKDMIASFAAIRLVAAVHGETLNPDVQAENDKRWERINEALGVSGGEL